MYPKEKQSVLLTQVRESYFSADCGMTYVIRLPDGSFWLIDAGLGEYDQPEHLLKLLQAQSTEARPRVAAWFFTHPHGDHINGFINLLRQYPDSLQIDEVVRRWPDPEYCSCGCDAPEFEALLLQLQERGTKITVPHRGQIWETEGCRAEVLFVCNDLYPEQISGLNNSSLMLRTDLYGHRVLWLGDCEWQSAKWLCAHYPAEELKCELLQVGHHGYWGGSDALYHAADPRVLLWPCPDFWYHTVRLWDCNRFLRESEAVEQTLVAGQGEYTLCLRPGAVELLPAAEVNEPDGAISRAHIERHSIVDLGWSCLTGGKTGYLPLTASFPAEGGIALATQGDAVSVCALLQPGATDGRGTVEFHLSGRYGSVEGQVGLLWDDPTPMEWSPDRVLWLDATSGAPFDLSLTVDPITRQATLRQAGAPERTITCQTDRIFGLHLCMKRADLLLRAVEAFQK